MESADVDAPLRVAEEQLKEAKRLTDNVEAWVRMDAAIHLIHFARSRTQAAQASDNAAPTSAEGFWPLRIRWDRPRKGQRFEAHLLADGSVRLQDGRVATPSGACRKLVGYSQWRGWTDWRYWDEHSQSWLPIDELRVAGHFDGSILPSTAEPSPLTYRSDPVLAELWDNEDDAIYDNV